jgi:tetratricopeptide (TPR) repeat protein
MRNRDQRRPSLPAELTSAEREFFLELRRLVDVAGFSCRALEESTSSFKSADDNSCFYSKSQWGRWLNAQSLPPRKAVRRLAEMLAKEDVDAGRLLDLWARTFVPSDAEGPGQADNGLTRPQQLPGAIAQFIGRAAELEVLSGLARQATGNGGMVITVITGTVGVGKTTLANYLGHRVCHQFPDGQLHVNLRGFDQAGQPMAASAALRGFLDALGVPPKSIPFGLDDQASLYRSLVADKRLLILLDNARDVEQVRLLLPGSPGCLVVVTSRDDLTGLVAEGAHAMNLAPFTLEDALELLTCRLGPRRVEREARAATELTELCARLPLAVSVAAAHAAARPDFSLAVLASELRERGLDMLDTGDPATTARTVFSWSYQHLSGGAARMFRLLGIHPGPDTSVPAAASLSAVPREQARRALLELARAHLVEEHLPGRFAFHDLLRSYAAEQARAHDADADLRAAELRLLDHYLRTAHSGARRLRPARDDYVKSPPPQPGAEPECLVTDDDVMAWFRTEHYVLLAAAAHAAVRRFGAYCWQIPWTLIPYLIGRGHWDDYASTQQAALAASLCLDDPVGAGNAHYELAHAFALLGDLEAAEAHARDAVTVFNRLGDEFGEAVALQGVERVLLQQGRYEEALPFAREALRLGRRHGSAAATCVFENALGELCAVLGRYDEALQHSRRALDMMDMMGDEGSRRDAAQALHTLGLAYSRLGDHRQAVAHYQQALTIYQELGELPLQVSGLAGLSDAQFAAGDDAAAQESQRRAQAILDGLPPQAAQQVKAWLSRSSVCC